MRRIFIDSQYWIAVFNPRDQWHKAAMHLRTTLGSFQGVTTTAVLLEVANYFSAFGPIVRQATVENIQDILSDASIETVPERESLFLDALALYAARLDKQYSLIDCLTMVVSILALLTNRQ